MMIPDVSMFRPDRLPDTLGKPVVVSFSGGQTSALMSAIIASEYRDRRQVDVNVLFANTGAEHVKTLDFVHACDRAWNLGVVWIEADISPDRGMGTRPRVVDYESASRNGAPFEAGCAKYGLPNTVFKWCTRELKSNPLDWYARKVLGLGDSLHAIGIRADEVDRISLKAMDNGFFYPLADLGVTKRQVSDWWSEQTFRLDIPGYLGNCVWCYKKSDRKLFAALRDDPSIFDFPERMEALHASSGTLKTGEPRRIYRKNRTVADMRHAAKKFESGFLFGDEDLGGGCGDSCEIGADED